MAGSDWNYFSLSDNDLTTNKLWIFPANVVTFSYSFYLSMPLCWQSTWQYNVKYILMFFLFLYRDAGMCTPSVQIIKVTQESEKYFWIIHVCQENILDISSFILDNFKMQILYLNMLTSELPSWSIHYPLYWTGNSGYDEVWWIYQS